MNWFVYIKKKIDNLNFWSSLHESLFDHESVSTGEGSRMVRELFVMAREHAPSIIFMDEIDSIGSSRIESGSGGDSEVQRTMLELLNQLDGFEATKNIKVS